MMRITAAAATEASRDIRVSTTRGRRHHRLELPHADFDARERRGDPGIQKNFADHCRVTLQAAQGLGSFGFNLEIKRIATETQCQAQLAEFTRLQAELQNLHRRAKWTFLRQHGQKGAWRGADGSESLSDLPCW